MATFQVIVDEALIGATTAYQWGNAVPIHPALFQKNLMDQAKAMNINWPSQASAGDQQQAADMAVIEYAVFYNGLLNRVKTEPEPSNPTPEFDAWWNAQKAAV